MIDPTGDYVGIFVKYSLKVPLPAVCKQVHPVTIVGFSPADKFDSGGRLRGIHPVDKDTGYLARHIAF